MTSRKRVADGQLNKDVARAAEENEEDVGAGSSDERAGWRASDAVLAKRRVVKARRRADRNQVEPASDRKAEAKTSAGSAEEAPQPATPKESDQPPPTPSSASAKTAAARSEEQPKSVFAGFRFDASARPSNGVASGITGFQFQFSAPPKSSTVPAGGSAKLFTATADQAGDDGGGGDDEDSDGGAGHGAEEPATSAPDLAAFNNEADEEPLLQMPAKLYELEQGRWKERGAGPLRVLRHRTKGTARVVMRVEGVLRVILNMPLAERATQWQSAGDKAVRLAGPNVCSDADDATASNAKPPILTGLLRFKSAEQADAFSAACAQASRSKPTASKEKE
eukprot:ctg_77.g31